ncbi:MAG: FGGY-family carbohydrate kinase [Victivallaceae bacterium]|jgi:sugar (pentulose or hexulose) kinase
MEKSYLAFDLGASSGRGIIGKIKDGKLHLTEIHRFGNGPVEKDGALYWEFDKLCKEIKTGIRKAVATGEKISSIAIDTWGVDYVLFKNGAPVRAAYHYRDSRTDAVPEKVYKIIPQKEIYARTGIQFMQLNTLYQLYAHKEAHPEDFNGSVMLLMPDALTYMLNGDISCEYSEASTSNLLNPGSRDWDFELIKRLGIPCSVFPKIVPPCSKSLPLKKSVEDEIGCGPIPVVKVGSHDTASAVAAVPAPLNKKWAYISVGTWALLGAEIDAPILTEEAGEAPFTNEGGLNRKIRFLTNIMGTWLFQETRRVWNEQGRNLGFADMNKMAKAAQGLQFFIDPNDNAFLSPGDMPAKVAAFCREHGQGDIPGDGALLRCIYDSLALYFRIKLEKLQTMLGVKYECLNIVGGGTQDTLLMQLTADCLGIPVIAGPVEATAIGNIMAQAIAGGDIYSLAEAREIIRKSFEVQEYVPEQSTKKAWDAAAKSFLKTCK